MASNITSQIPTASGGNPRSRIHAVLLMLTALMLFAALDTSAKYLVQREGLSVV